LVLGTLIFADFSEDIPVSNDGVLRLIGEADGCSVLRTTGSDWNGELRKSGIEQIEQNCGRKKAKAQKIALAIHRLLRRVG
jgi:hypothetical protein